MSYRRDPNEEVKLQSVENLWLRGGCATSRAAFGAPQTLSGSLHGTTTFCQNLLVHTGTTLYRLTDGVLTTLLTGLPDKKSVAVEFSGKLYVYCDRRIFCVDRSLCAKEVFPKAPVLCTDCVPRSALGASVSKPVLNQLAPYVAVTYKSPEAQYLQEGYRFPSDMDTARPFEVYVDDTLVEASEYTVETKHFHFTTYRQTADNAVKLCYYTIKKAYAALGEALAGCKAGTAFGGGTLEGTRVFLAGNETYPGRFFTSELGDPLCFVENSGGTLGESTGDITGFAKQSGDLLIFTESTLSRMTYHYLSSGGGYFSIKTIHAGIGCDIPQSIALVDNRTVFASSTHGICIVDNTEWTDRLNVMPISRSIDDPACQKGFFALTADKRRSAVACLFDRKYILYADGKAFIWDFGETPYASSSDPEKAAGRLAWFVFESLSGRILTDTQTLYTCKEDKESCTLEKMLPDGEGKMHFSLHSGESTLGQAQVSKAVTGLAFTVRCEQKTTLTLSVFADGKRYHTCVVRTVPNENGFASVYVPFVGRSMERFSFSVSGEQSGVGLFDFRVDHHWLKKQKYQK